jgi:hypothetical protein
MEQDLRTRLARNIFWAAHQACEPWERFPWRSGRDGSIETWLAHASQGLVIDVFGTIKMSSNRDPILNAIAQTVGLPPGGPWDLTLEWNAPRNLLNEPRPMRVDVYAESPHSVILFECKFTEPAGGACSQTFTRNGFSPCNGTYVQQRDAGNAMASPCALSRKGIRYWDIIPDVFHLDARNDHCPCPFAGSTYQWMRNLVVGYESARKQHKQPAVIIVYADSPSLPMAKKVRSKAWAQFTEMVRQDRMAIGVLAYQEVLTLAQKATRDASSDQAVWRELGEWINKKISASERARRKTKRRLSFPRTTPSAGQSREGREILVS